MSDLRFENQGDEYGRPPESNKGSDFTGKIVELGIASNRQQAEYVMIGLVIFIVSISIFVYRSSTG